MLAAATASLGFIAPSSLLSKPTGARMSVSGAVDYVKKMPGEGPLGFFDPWGFTSNEDMTEGRARYYREVELKHGRVAMLAALGFLVGEHFHPLFGGDVDGAPARL